MNPRTLRKVLALEPLDVPRRSRVEHLDTLDILTVVVLSTDMLLHPSDGLVNLAPQDIGWRERAWVPRGREVRVHGTSDPKPLGIERELGRIVRLGRFDVYDLCSSL